VNVSSWMSASSTPSSCRARRTDRACREGHTSRRHVLGGCQAGGAGMRLRGGNNDKLYAFGLH
jgi:hypothetical protein